MRLNMKYCEMGEAGKARMRAATKRWCERNPEKVKSMRNDWYARNAESRREAGRKSYHKNKHKRDPEKARKQSREWNANNRERSHEIAKAWRERKKAERADLKRGMSCVLCGESEPKILCFHHTTVGEKSFNVAYKISVMSKGRLEEEIKKCVILCRNCHKRVHAGTVVLPGYEGVPVPKIGRPKNVVEKTNE
jgi:hypothetical protein